MALPSTAQQVFYARHLRKPLIDQIALQSVLKNRLMKKAELKGGSGVEFPLSYAYNNNIGTITPYDTNNYKVSTGPTKGYEDFVAIQQMMAYSELEHARSKGTDENKKGIDDLAYYVSRAEITLGHYLSMMIYGDGSVIQVPETGRTITPFPGLRKIISASNTVHGIAQGAYPWFQRGYGGTGSATYATFIDSTTPATYVQNLIRAGVGDCSVNGERPDLIVTTHIVRDALAQTMVSNQRYVNVDGVASLSFRALEFEGIPVVVDDECPAGYIFILNTNHLFIYGNKNMWFKMGDWEKVTGGDGWINAITADLTMICDSPRHQGIITTCPMTR